MTLGKSFKLFVPQSDLWKGNDDGNNNNKFFWFNEIYRIFIIVPRI